MIGVGGGLGFGYQHLKSANGTPIILEEIAGRDFEYTLEFAVLSNVRGGDQYPDTHGGNIFTNYGNEYYTGGIGVPTISDLKRFKLKPRLGLGVYSSIGWTNFLWKNRRTEEGRENPH